MHLFEAKTTNTPFPSINPEIYLLFPNGVETTRKSDNWENKSANRYREDKTSEQPTDY
ncbi:hypothetical protein P872_15685 [Rhodonellum psychrophilum GCM71 = DSM 17998]|uniref:Uncharacterized protein n=1 Tax=Rhodonellum psychrophilum GCM71 = DSM 17998 TaxID=1123057 RepID=U5C7N9_9BACT|nr:hypothetical protein P872_15685 [Rhodonellum psychrophilum GCM71 = DSM 17998]